MDYNSIRTPMGKYKHIESISAVLLLAVGVLIPGARAQSRLQYGINVASEEGVAQARAMGCTWVKIYDAGLVPEVERRGLRALLMIGWETPPTDIAAWGDRVYHIVSSYRGRIAAYEIGNEPNIASEWDGLRRAEPAEYVALLRQAYIRAKQADPNCIIVSAGLAPNGEHSSTALDDVEFLRGMYEAGAKGYFDVLGAHPNGFAYAPEDKYSNPILCFRRVEDLRAVMVAYGDGDKPIWATECGWILDPGEGCRYYGDWWSRWWQRVTLSIQADYLVRACRYAEAHWPWMEAVFIWNLDFSTVPWYHPCDPMVWYSILNPDGSPRPAYNALQEMLGSVVSPPTTTPTATPWPGPTPAPGSGTLWGQVYLGGRTDHAGVRVSAGGAIAWTNEAGHFALIGLAPASYDILAEKSGFLRAERRGVTVGLGQVIRVPDVTLTAGDVNGDCAINLLDLVSVGLVYGQCPPSDSQRDVNSDGCVNLFDLVLVGLGYDRACPVSW